MIAIEFHCPKCKEAVSVPEEYDEPYVWCHNCLTRIGVPGTSPLPVFGPRTPARATPALTPPWTPWQVLASSFLFGPLAGGVVTGINFARMGKRVRLSPWVFAIPWTLAGAVLFGLLALGVIVQPTAADALLGALANFIIAAYFALTTVRPFEAWKALNLPQGVTRGVYRPGRLGQLLLVDVACLAIQAAIIALMVLLI
jgi:hypothetical protein